MENEKPKIEDEAREASEYTVPKILNFLISISYSLVRIVMRHIWLLTLSSVSLAFRLFFVFQVCPLWVFELFSVSRTWLLQFDDHANFWFANNSVHLVQVEPIMVSISIMVILLRILLSDAFSIRLDGNVGIDGAYSKPNTGLTIDLYFGSLVFLCVQLAFKITRVNRT